MTLDKLQKIKAAAGQLNINSKYKNTGHIYSKALDKADNMDMWIFFLLTLGIGIAGALGLAILDYPIWAAIAFTIGMTNMYFSKKIEKNIYKYYQKKMKCHQYSNDLCDLMESQQKPIMALLQNIDAPDLQPNIHKIKLALMEQRFYDAASEFCKIEEELDAMLKTIQQQEKLVSYEKEMGLRPLGLKANL